MAGSHLSPDDYPTEVYSRGGSLPKSVYVRRRIAVLAAAIAVIAVIVMIVVGPGRGASSNGDGVKPQPGAVEGGTEGASDGSETPAAIGPCDTSKLAVEAVTDAADYGPGELPQLSLRITNHGDVACDADLGTSTQLYEIKSGSELYWNSKDCQIGASKNLVRMQPGQTLETEAIVWDRTRSNPETCESDRELVPADGVSYHLSVEIAGTKSANTKQFLLY